MSWLGVTIESYCRQKLMEIEGIVVMGFVEWQFITILSASKFS